MRRLVACLALLVPVIVVPTASAHARDASPLPHGSATWVYDDSTAGQWADRISAYNASASHDLSVIFSYGTDLEMYCPADNPARCTIDDLYSYYTPGSSGWASSQAYAAGVAGAQISPIIDGVVGSEYLSGLNGLSAKLAAAWADKVAAQVCADSNAAGIQFDLEPYDVSTKNGQYFFYREIAKALATGACVDATHPQGRYFSVFTFASSIEPGTAGATNTAAFLNHYGNGYLLDSLYDLGTKPGGWLNTPARYASLVRNEVTHLVTWADAAGIAYGFGVPGGASAHEYTTCTGTPCHQGAGAASGYPMVQYTSRALAAVDASGARSDPLFVGDALWYFGAGPQQHPGYSVTPAPVPPAVLNFVSDRL